MSPAKDPGSHPWLRGEISRWVWRMYAQRLTKAGRWLVLPTVVLSTYSGSSLQLQGYVAFAYVAGLWWVAIVAMVVSRPRVKIAVAHADRVSVGETAVVDVEVTLVGRRGRDLVVIAHRLPEELDLVPEDGVGIGDLKRGEKGKARLGILCKRRGAYVIKGFRVESDWPFGIWRSRQVIARERALLVYPKFTRLARLGLPAGRTYQPGGVAMASNLGESAEFIGNREYREGDNIRDIDWRATARMCRPIVREYREEYFMRVAVILDTHVPRGAGDLQRDMFECAVSVGAGVSDYMARQDYLVDLFAAGPNLYHLTAGRSLAYLDQILDILACVGKSEAEPFGVIEPELLENLSRITTVICVLLDWDEARRAFVHRLAREGAAVKVIIVREGKCTLDPSGDSDVFGRIVVLEKSECERGVEEL
ncbi:MAG TPA: DUF58 domain-containing protein [Tepidisphaeraceae bacterium]|nr:DUF58 domain-containing protein [Tepidisphaeraceae bacterium]